MVLLGKEWRELMASRAWWVLLLVMGPLVGVSFISAVRTYESPLDRRLEEQGFESVATVSLLLKETMVRVAEPALVTATP